MRHLLPEGWPRPSGYSNGIIADGVQLHVAGMIGWNEKGELADTFEGQVEQALRNTLAVLAEGDAVVDAREEEAPPTVERRATVRRLFGPKRKAPKKKPLAENPLSIRVADLEERLARSEARAARFASQLDAMSQTVDALQARDLARAATRTPPPAPTTTPPPPSTPPPPPVVTARRSLEALDLKIGRDGSVVDDFLAAREATGVCPDSPEPPREPPAPTSAPPPPPPLGEDEAPAPPPRRVKLSGWTAAALDAGPPPAPARPRAPSLLSDDDDDRVMPIW